MHENSPIIDQNGMSARRLFCLPPGDILEHPTDLTTEPMDILDGPIEGWDAYAPNWDGDPRAVIGPFTAVVSRPYDDGRPVITVRIYKHSETDYIFDTADRQGTGRPDRPCWYQSGTTLRFVRKRTSR